MLHFEHILEGLEYARFFEPLDFKVTQSDHICERLNNEIECRCVSIIAFSVLLKN